MVKRDVIFKKERALRKALDTGVEAIGDQELETWKTE
jgi:hypothetical protein